MKTRLILIAAALLAVGLLAKFATPIIKHEGRGGRKGPPLGLGHAASPSRLDYLCDEWLGDARTAAAALRYLLEPEPPESNEEAVASNAAKGALPGPGVSLPQTPPPAPSNGPAPRTVLVLTQLANGYLFVYQDQVGSNVTLRRAMICSPCPFKQAFGVQDATRLAGPAADGRGDSVGCLLCLDCRMSFNLVEPPNAPATNSQLDSKAPAKNRRPARIDTAERPA